MLTDISLLWAYLRARSALPAADERGSVVETVIIVAVFAALALAIGTSITLKVTNKANSINLN